MKLDQYISFLPKYILENDLKNKTITQINLPDYQIDVYRQLLCHKDKWLSHEMKAFFQLIKRKILKKNCILQFFYNSSPLDLHTF